MSDSVPLGGLTSVGGLTLAATGIAKGLWWLIALAVVLLIAGMIILRLAFRRRSDIRHS